MTQTNENIDSKIPYNVQQEYMNLRDNASKRIKRFRKRFLKEKPYISIQRAKYYTEGWKKFKDSPNIVRVAESMKNVFEKMNLNVDRDDRIVGSWTEFFFRNPN